MPHHDGVYDEMNRSPAFADAIARARTESAHGLAMEALEIADSAGPDEIWIKENYNRAIAKASDDDRAMALQMLEHWVQGKRD